MFVQWSPIVYIKTGNITKFLVMIKIFNLNILKFLVVIKIFDIVLKSKIPNVVCRSDGAHCKGGGENVCRITLCGC